ncbi:MAG: C39 family peptidase [Opitutales bacterium]
MISVFFTRLNVLGYCALALALWGNVVSGRTFTDTQGRSIEAEFIRLEGETVTIRRGDGMMFDIPLAMLSAGDQAYVKARAGTGLVPTGGPEPAALNELFGVELFSAEPLWREDVGAVAKRLSWPQESATERLSSYRLYPPEDYRILEERPHSAALYAEGGNPERLSLVFANKGDLGYLSLEAIEEVVESQAEAMQRRLKRLLGEPGRINMGKSDLKERVDRWDWRGHAILLSEQEGEYVALRVMPPDIADNRGFGERLADSEMSELLPKNVQTHENGDVLVSGIPMVDQGPKGYCVPATFERYLRYMSIPADMYVLAMAGQTGVGGGSNLNAFLDNISHYVSYAGRDLTEESMDAEIRDVARRIDDGIPVMWTMFSTSPYNEVANLRTKERKAQDDWQAWKERCESEDELAETMVPQSRQNPHMCMIVGYNAETGELAVSDSWGPAYELRWITEEQAKQASAGLFYIIKI